MHKSVMSQNMANISVCFKYLFQIHVFEILHSTVGSGSNAFEVCPKLCKLKSHSFWAILFIASVSFVLCSISFYIQMEIDIPGIR